MPGLARKLLVFAAVDGLFVQAAGQRVAEDRNTGVRIAYGGSNTITTAREQNETLEGASLEAHGIVGASRRLRLSCTYQFADLS